MRYIIYCDEIGNPRSNPVDEDNSYNMAIEIAKWIAITYCATSFIWDINTHRNVYMFKGHIKPTGEFT